MNVCPNLGLFRNHLVITVPLPCHTNFLAWHAVYYKLLLKKWKEDEEEQRDTNDLKGKMGKGVREIEGGKYRRTKVLRKRTIRRPEKSQEIILVITLKI